VNDPNWDDLVTVGRIVRPQGNRGQVVVASETDFGADRFRPGEVVWWYRDGRPERVQIKDSRPHDHRWVVGFEGIGTIDAAESLRDFELRVPAATLRPLGPNQYYLHDLVGCQVETGEGVSVGAVERVELRSGTPNLVVKGAFGEVFVPLAETICRRIDPPARRIVIDPPPGLLELNR
jgi:16S rRNA processing protein RimM